MVVSDLSDICKELRGLEGHFPVSPGIPAELPSAQRATFRQLVMEARAVISSELPLSDFGTHLLFMQQNKQFGMFKSPSRQELHDAIATIQGAMNQITRKERTATAPNGASAPGYAAPTRIQELRALSGNRWDTRRPVRLLEELNAVYAAGCLMATAMIVRAVVDHVPPVFGKKTFTEVANSHAAGTSAGRSFKGSMQHLDNSMKNIADQLLHVQIRNAEVLPATTQVDFTQDLDVLLAEVVRLLKV